MKKIISTGILIVAMAWTWNVIHSSTAVSFETHSSLQTQLARLIEKTLTDNKPQLVNLKINRLWTESLSENKIRAIFSYTFSEKDEGGEVSEQTVEGEAELYRSPTEDPEKQNSWVLQTVKTTSGTLVFSEGSVVSPQGTSNDTEEAAQDKPAADSSKQPAIAKPQQPSNEAPATTTEKSQ
ncbi:MAG: hypothetical protein ACOYOK_08140 [Pseudobdellovibrionaceae bacterium]